MIKNTHLALIHKYFMLLALAASLAPMNGHATINADFSLKAQYSRNKKIWGTYKLNREKLSIVRGRKKWLKKPTSRVGDIIITNGHITFIRETKKDGKTKIVVDKIPYKLEGKGVFVNKGPLDKEIMDRLYRPDLKSVTPHLDLIQGTIEYKQIKCTKKRGALDCVIEGQILPQV